MRICRLCKYYYCNINQIDLFVWLWIDSFLLFFCFCFLFCWNDVLFCWICYLPNDWLSHTVFNPYFCYWRENIEFVYWQALTHKHHFFPFIPITIHYRRYIYLLHNVTNDKLFYLSLEFVFICKSASIFRYIRHVIFFYFLCKMGFMYAVCE